MGDGKTPTKFVDCWCNWRRVSGFMDRPCREGYSDDVPGDVEKWILHSQRAVVPNVGVEDI